MNDNEIREYIGDLDLLENTLNAEAGRFKYSDVHLRNVLLRAQAAIQMLRDNNTKRSENTCQQ